MSESETPAAADITRLLHQWHDGSTAAGERLMGVVYDQLHAIAEARMRREREGHTLQSTALVHEAYLRLVEAGVEWSDRGHFFAVAARTMRRVLTDHARGRHRAKRGGALERITLSNLPGDLPGERVDLIALDGAIEELDQVDPRKAAAIELHYYGGLSYEEVAEALDISPATVHRDLRAARAWLKSRLA